MLKICLLLAVDVPGSDPTHLPEERRWIATERRAWDLCRKSGSCIPVIWINVVASFIQMSIWWEIVYPNDRNTLKC